ncbi:MAG: DUF4416 family protein, partial [Desulfobacterales bacterium]
MSVLQPPKPAKLVIGIFTAEVNIVETLVPELISHFGRIDVVSPWMAFNYTHYYEPEMGSPLHRRVYSFKSLIGQQDLANVKIATHQIEQAYSKSGRRRVNIDPGYLVRERFVLASGKNFSHRICIGAGIYADLTLIYQKGRFRQLPWTYPDYADGGMLNFLE